MNFCYINLVIWFDGSEVDGHEEGGGKDGPHGHLGFALLVAQPEVSNDEHVGIVPVSGPGVGDDGVLRVVHDMRLVSNLAPLSHCFNPGVGIRKKKIQPKFEGGLRTTMKTDP